MVAVRGNLTINRALKSAELDPSKDTSRFPSLVTRYGMRQIAELDPSKVDSRDCIADQQHCASVPCSSQDPGTRTQVCCHFFPD